MYRGFSWQSILGKCKSRRQRSRYIGPEDLEPRLVLSAFSIGGPESVSGAAAAVDDSGNVYVAGSFRGTIDLDPGPGLHEVTSAGETFGDAFLAKYDTDGNLLWGAAFEDALIGDVEINNGGKLVVTGSFRGVVDFDLGGGVQTLDAGTRQGAFVTVYDTDGNLELRRQMGGGTTFGTSFVSGQFLDVDTSGNIYVAGSMSRGSADFDPGPGVFNLSNGSGNNDTFITKLDVDGNFVWAKKFTNDPTIAAGVWPHDISVDASENVFVSGIFVGRTDFDPSGSDFTLAADGGSTTQRSGDGYVARLNADGSLGYAVKIGSSTRRDDTYGVVADAAGNAYVTGTTNPGGAIFGTAGTVSISSVGSNDAYLARLDLGGAVDWAYRFGSGGSDGGSHIELASDGSVFLAGYYANTVDFDRSAGTANLTSRGSFDPFLLQTSGTGDFIDLWTVGSPQYDFPDELALSPSDDVVLAGRFTDTGDFELGDGVTNLTPVGGSDMFVSFLERDVTNDPPIADNSSLSVDEDSSESGTLTATDPEGAPVSFQLADTSNANGTVTLNSATGDYTYVPDENFNGAASFTFTATDGSNTSAPATVSITVNPVEDAPIAHNRTLIVNEDSSVQTTLGAEDGDNDPLTFELVDTSGAQGSVELLNANTGEIRYTPSANYHGPATFTFRVNDGDEFSNVATVSVTVVSGYDPPEANDGVLNAVEDTPASGILTATNVDGSFLRFRLLDTSNARGRVEILNASTGEYSYVPDADYFGAGELTFSVTDGQTTSTATILIDVAPVNDPPQISDATFEIEENSATGTQVGQVIATDIDDVSLTYTITGGNTDSAFAIDAATGKITVHNSAALDFETTPQFELTVRVEDSGGLSDTAIVTINLTDIAELRRLQIDVLKDRFSSRSRGKVEVAIFGESTFDVRSIDIDSVRFGATGTEDSLSRHKRHGPRVSYRDLNGDGILDVVLTFELRQAGFSKGDTTGFLTATTLSGQELFGEDSVNVR